MNTNKISATLTDADKAAAIGHLESIKTLFPFLQGLSAEDKTKIKRAGDNRLPFIQKALTYAQQHPEVLAGAFSLPEFAKDVTFMNQFLPFLAALEAFREKCNDTETLAEFEAYKQGRDVYDAFKRANSSGEYDIIVADLSTTFETMGQKTANTAAAKPNA